MKITKLSKVLYIVLIAGFLLQTAYTYSQTKKGYDNELKKTVLGTIKSIYEHASIHATSGLAYYNNVIWTHNDSDINNPSSLIAINPNSTFYCSRKLSISNKEPDHDWEEIAISENNIFIGDFGNNKGERIDKLCIYSFKLSDLDCGSRTILNCDKKYDFKYCDSTGKIINLPDAEKKDMSHNYDCEAMIYFNNKLYLFSKNWKDCKEGNCTTAVYEIDLNEKLAPTKKYYSAKLSATISTHGLITGATISKIDNSYRIALIGYEYITSCDKVAEITDKLYCADIFMYTFDINNNKTSLIQADFIKPKSFYLADRIDLRQVEAICYDKAKKQYILSGEKTNDKNTGWIFSIQENDFIPVK